MKWKVCGMKFPENIASVAALQPDYLGFIFYPDSPRNFANEIPEISSAIKKTGVFVDAPLAVIAEKTKQFNFRAIQLHGNESADFCSELKEVLGAEVEIIKVFSIKDDFDYEKLVAYEGKVDYFLFDTKGKNKGGNGYAFDWEILKNYPSQTPFFLSGGIGPQDIVKIERFKQHLEEIGKGNLLHAVDVNSKFEAEPGLKKIQELENFRKSIS